MCVCLSHYERFACVYVCIIQRTAPKKINAPKKTKKQKKKKTKKKEGKDDGDSPLLPPVQVRVHALLCLGDFVSRLDSASVHHVLQTMAACSAVDHTPPTLMCILGLAHSINRKVSTRDTRIADVSRSAWLQNTELVFGSFSLGVDLRSVFLWRVTAFCFWFFFGSENKK